MFGRKKKSAADKDKKDKDKARDAGRPSAATRRDSAATGSKSGKGLSSAMADMSLAEKDAAAAAAAKKKERGSSAGSSSSSSKRQSISYAAERVIGNGSFGVVYQATVIETGQTVAIKKVLQDRRFKNRELQIMRMLSHPAVVSLQHSFLARGERPDDVYLNLVMEFVPETIHRTLRNHTKAKKLVPLMYTKVYLYQVCRSLAYIHSLGICHRDIKPQNLLLDPQTHIVKLCDFGSAKILVKGQPNVAYICSRYYRAPELVFEATEYSTAIDIWSLGCVMAELLLGKPLFPGDSGVDQLIEIIKILGTPTREEIHAMNPNHTSFSFPQIAPHPWSKVFRGKAPLSAIDLVSRLLQYKPTERLDPFVALTHEFFDELREPNAHLPNSKPLPPTVFNFSPKELKMAQQLGILEKLVPPHMREKLGVHADGQSLAAKPDDAAA